MERGDDLGFILTCEKCGNHMNIDNINLHGINQKNEPIFIGLKSGYGGEAGVDFICDCGNNISIDDY